MSIADLMWGRKPGDPLMTRSPNAAQPGVNPKAQVDERAAELGVQLEPGSGPVVLADGLTMIQEPRYVVTPKIVAPAPRDMSASTQLAERLAIADARVESREAALKAATAALDAARTARGQNPDAQETLAELQRCRAALDVATDDLAVCTTARDQLKTQIAGWKKEIAAYEKAAAESTPDALRQALPLARAEALGVELAAIAKEAHAAVAIVLRARTTAEDLADTLAIRYRDRGADVPTAILAIAMAIQKGWRSAGQNGSIHKWLGG